MEDADGAGDAAFGACSVSFFTRGDSNCDGGDRDDEPSLPSRLLTVGDAEPWTDIRQL